ncbi:outer membrane transport energization protein ExbB [[Leptolyngbya] sp. PCC 7376]|uniref:MotA/TolQ/ExbB proton channel family protein n=1 Tax=[Leptolyngbya] sp. PCC 7376 TaxID=111781 RepID=UPI00029F0199|nr:MotA/TolQ/ExbB proton channel family protein [[Leptolyngbya] sp. PCC 7376]AFY38632.1 outer membrane transport energization protein ExbB [[Leptolyngbya] sp. PCC 7376]
MAWTELLTTGGWVTIPLFLCSIISVTLIAERLFFWFRINRGQRPLLSKVLMLYRDDQNQAIALLKQNQHLPICRIYLEAMSIPSATSEELTIALETAAKAEIPILKRFNTVFETIIAVAPLLGLLGTILGLMNSFSSLKIGDVGSTQTVGVTAGISEALISTAAGLIIAIITLLFANSFRGFYIRQLNLIQEYGGQLELLHRRL